MSIKFSKVCKALQQKQDRASIQIKEELSDVKHKDFTVLKNDHVTPKTEKGKLSGMKMMAKLQKSQSSTKREDKLMNTPFTTKMEDGESFVCMEPEALKAMRESCKYINWKQAYEAAEVLLKVREEPENKLFSDEGQPIVLKVTSIKVAKTPSRQIRLYAFTEHIYLLLQLHICITESANSQIYNKHFSVLPHTLLTPTSEVCLFVSDLERGKKIDHEPTVQRWKDMLRHQGITQVTEVIPIRQLKVEFDQYELKRSLCERYDCFLSEGKVSGHIFKLLGKTFFRRRKTPVPVDLKFYKMKGPILRALHKTTLYLSGKGNAFGIRVAHTKHTPEEIADNIIALVEGLAEYFPGGWENIRSLFLKTQGAPIVPVYFTLKSSNAVRTPIEGPKRPRAYVPVTGELSTLPNARVTVYPTGRIKVEKSEDFDFGSDEEGNSDEYKAFLERNNMLPDDKPAQKKEGSLKREKVDKKKPLHKRKKTDDTEDALEAEEAAYLQDWKSLKRKIKKEK